MKDKRTSVTVIAEAYGSSDRSNLYVKEQDQSNVVLIESGTTETSVKKWFTELFMPQGYPDSVSSDYLKYQIWDTAQAFCSTITGILATQEVLRGVGVGSHQASVLAATITWVLKDGCGHLGRILFAYLFGSQLDTYSKMWRLYADTLNDASMCIELFLSYFGSYTTIVLCISTIMRAIVGVAGGATRVAMTQHHAIRNNLGDVSAKDSAQETAVNLIASLVALLIITLFSNSMVTFTFALMVVLHLFCNYNAVRAVCLQTLNEPRYLLFLERYMIGGMRTEPSYINSLEPVLYKLCSGPTFKSGFYPSMVNLKINMGKSLKLIFNRVDAGYMSELVYCYCNERYMIIEDLTKNELFGYISNEWHSEVVLQAYYHAVVFQIYLKAINDYPECNYPNKDIENDFDVIREVGIEKFREPIVPNAHGWKYKPTHYLHMKVKDIVKTHWKQVSYDLEDAGWDLNTYLLDVDDWRICDEKDIQNKKDD